MIACWNDNMLDILGEILLQLILPVLFYFFNVATRTFTSTYVTWISHIIFLLDSTVLDFLMCEKVVLRPIKVGLTVTYGWKLPLVLPNAIFNHWILGAWKSLVKSFQHTCRCYVFIVFDQTIALALSLLCSSNATSWLLFLLEKYLF